MFETLKPKIKDITSSSELSIQEKLQQICDFLRQNVPHYHWVGFYFHKENDKILELAQYSGTSTDHTTIPFGKGICGQVALSNKNFVVPDVKIQDNYIACSTSVKSEIVIPIFVNRKNIGQIDIDSEYINPFSEKDERFLEWICTHVSTFIKVKDKNINE